MKKIITGVLGSYLNALHVIAPQISGAHGFRLFCYPFRPALKRHQRIFLESARHDRLIVQGEEIQTYRWGTGKKNVLLMHGWQSHSFRWKALVEAFPLDQYTLYAVDAPGHGLSSGNFLTVPLYSAVVERLIDQLREINTIIAHSLGAFTALYTMSRLPYLPVGKLALLASPGQATEFINFYQNTLGLNPKTVSAVKNHFERVIGETLEYFSAPAFASAIRQTGLLIHDEEDKETPHTHSILIHQAWERSELVITRGLGHNLKSREIIERVIQFVGEAAGQGNHDSKEGITKPNRSTN